MNNFVVGVTLFASPDFGSSLCGGDGLSVQTLTFVLPQGEQGEAGNPGPSGEPGTGVSKMCLCF